jgi:hypothetical protein
MSKAYQFIGGCNRMPTPVVVVFPHEMRLRKPEFVQTQLSGDTGTKASLVKMIAFVQTPATAVGTFSYVLYCSKFG